jgi:hypothetical protein
MYCYSNVGCYRSVPSFSPTTGKEQWGKVNSCWQLTIRLIGPISPACDRYVQYLLAGGNRTVLNRHRRGLQPSKCRLATYPLPDLPNQLSPLSPNGLARSPFNQLLVKDQSVEFLKNLWPSRGLSITRPSTVAYICA